MLKDSRFAANNDLFLLVNGDVACGVKFFRDGSGVARFSHFMKSPFLSLPAVLETGMFVLEFCPWLLLPNRSRIDEGRVFGEQSSFLVDDNDDGVIGVDSVLDKGALFSFVTTGVSSVVRSSAVVVDVTASLDGRVSSDTSFFEGTGTADFSFLVSEDGFFVVTGAEGLSLTVGGGNLRWLLGEATFEGSSDEGLRTDALSETDGGVVNLLLELLGEVGDDGSSLEDCCCCCSIFDFFSAAEDRVGDKGFLKTFGADLGELTLLRSPLILLPIFLLPFGLVVSSGSFAFGGDFVLLGRASFSSVREIVSLGFEGDFALDGFWSAFSREGVSFDFGDFALDGFSFFSSEGEVTSGSFTFDGDFVLDGFLFIGGGGDFEDLLFF